MPHKYEIQGISIDKSEDGGFVVCCNKYYPKAKKSHGFWDDDKFVFQKTEEDEAWDKVRKLYQKKWKQEAEMKKKYGSK